MVTKSEQGPCLDLMNKCEGRGEYVVCVHDELRPLPVENVEPGPMKSPDGDPQLSNCIADHFQHGIERDSALGWTD